MARENTVYLYGRLITDPRNRIDKEGNPVSSRMIIQTLRRSYVNDEMILQGKIIPDTPIVISRNPELIERMHLFELEKGDFVYVKGTVCTMETRNVISVHIVAMNQSKRRALLFILILFLQGKQKMILMNI